MTEEVERLQESIRIAVRGQTDRLVQAKRLFFDLPSHGLEGKHSAEFAIKRSISERYRVPFRSVVFTGSAQLGFSPHKATPFVKGRSDLDVGVISSELFQIVWMEVLDVSKNFGDESVFLSPQHVELLKSQLLRRGMILFDYLPKCQRRTVETSFWGGLNNRYREHFGRISLAVYVNEEAFCRKQVSALEEFLR